MSIITSSQEALGNQIAAKRVQRGLSQAELAEKAKVSRSCIAMIERGYNYPSIDTLVAISLSLNVRMRVKIVDGTT